MNDSTYLYRPGTKRHAIAALNAAGLTEQEAFSELREKVASQVTPWIFMELTEDGRRPKAISDQYADLQHEIHRTYAVIAQRSKS
jgi:hypothetical protein